MNLEHNPITTSLPQQVTLIEVGLRDGFQRLQPYIPLEKKVAILNGLVAAGIKEIQVTSFVHPKYVPQMADAEALCAHLPAQDEVTFRGLVLNLKGVERAANTPLSVLDMGIGATDGFNLRNARYTTQKGLEQMAQMVKLAHRATKRVHIAVAVAFGCAYDGHVAPERVLDIVKQLRDMGVDEIGLADSTGYANPAQIERMIAAVKPLIADLPLSLHLHDTRGMGIANCYAGLRQGVTRFDTAFGGLGGCPYIPQAKGNIATEDTGMMMQELGIETGINLAQVAAISHDFEAYFGIDLPGRVFGLL